MSVEIIAQLKELKLNGMATCYPELLAKARHSEFVPDTFMRQLIEAETAERTVRSMAYQMGAARFPTHRDLAGFDFLAAQVDEALVRELHQAKFIDSAQNVVLIGGPGTGKTHLASAIGIEALRTHAKRVRFFSTVELVNALELEKATGRTGQIANRLMHVDLVILDEVHHLPVGLLGPHAVAVLDQLGECPFVVLELLEVVLGELPPKRAGVIDLPPPLALGPERAGPWIRFQIERAAATLRLEEVGGAAVLL